MMAGRMKQRVGIYNNRRWKTVALMGMFLCILAVWSGWRDKESVSSGKLPKNLRAAMENENRAVEESASGNTIVIAGSASMEKFLNMAAEGFMEKYPEITVTVEFTGSSAGIESALAGRADVGSSSRNLEDEEKKAGAVETVVAIDGIAVITDGLSQITSLSAGQLADIYTGRIRNWNEVGGADMPIVVIGRESGSGTRNTFERLLGITDSCQYVNELDSAGAVLARVSSVPGAIGYVSFAVLNDTVQVLDIDGIKASAETVLSGEYWLWQPFMLVTDGDVGGQNAVIQRFFDYLWSEEGSELIRKAGLQRIPQDADR